MCTKKELYYQEIGFAQETLKKSKILCLSKRENMVCDIYCAVSVTHQTFYAQVYEDGEDFLLIYAKTYVKGFDDEFTTLSFSDCVRFSEHPAVMGKIVCGVKAVPKSDTFFCKLMECLPVEDKWLEDEGIIIDGVKTVIRSFYKGELCGVLRFRSSEQLKVVGYNTEQIKLLENLYIVIEDIISR